jgi:hypothetical protein
MGWSASVRNRSFFKDLSSENAVPASLWGKSGCVAGPLQTQLCCRKLCFPDGCLTLLGSVPSARPPHCQPQTEAAGSALRRSRRTLTPSTFEHGVNTQTQQCGPHTQQGRLERSGPQLSPDCPQVPWPKLHVSDKETAVISEGSKHPVSLFPRGTPGVQPLSLRTRDHVWHSYLIRATNAACKTLPTLPPRGSRPNCVDRSLASVARTPVMEA